MSTAVTATPAPASPPWSPGKSEYVMAAAAVVIIAGIILLRAVGATEMSIGMIIVVSLRIIVPFLIFRYWLFGAVVAMILDTADVILIDVIGLGGFGGNYAEVDKFMDSWYYIIELLVALRWTNRWMLYPAIALFIFRVIGAIIFEITGDHIVLFYFPNMFENWWLYCVVVMKWFPQLVPTNTKMVVIPMLILLVPKMAQEYLLHFSEAHPWNWTKENVLPKVGINL